MRPIVLALSVAPLALAGLSGLLWPPSQPATRSDRLAVQTIQFMRPEGPAAAPGWPVVSQEAPPLPDPRPFQAGAPAPPPVAKPARKIRRKPAGLCARHDLRKVWISSTRWRCRR